MKEESK